MKQNEELNNIITHISERRLGKALTSLENYLLTNPQQKDIDVLMGIKDDYRLMADYWQRGYEDPHREEVYNQLLRRLYILTANISIHWLIHQSPFLHPIYSRPRHIRKDWSISSVKKELETYVSDIAMLELDPKEERAHHEELLYNEHQHMLYDLFDYIITSRMWKDSLADAFEDILLSPTIDQIDQQLIVSAITLSALQAFDYNKFRVLVSICQKTADLQIRQRALVGIALSADASKNTIYPEISTLINGLCEDEDICKEMTELQIQLYYCMDAENDTRRIQQEIMPDLMNGSNVRLTRQGLVEVDEDTLEDILHPDAAERNMERMEKRMQQMADMQKQGADIYFGGFSQMKRFPFFNTISNWFMPFYPQHPDISSIWNKARGKKFLHILMNVGAFCDSDKYSFVLAFEMVLSRMPASMLKIIDEGEAAPIPVGGLIDEEEQHQPAFIRRMYLQNMYRFFRLYNNRAEFHNPFEHKNSLFFANPLFQQTALQQHFLEMARFLLKRKRYEEAMAVLNNCNDEQKHYDYFMLMGAVLQHLPETPLMTSALECYRIALKEQPDSQRALVGFARASFRCQDYQAALESYEKLLSMDTENKNYLLNTAVCLMNVDRNSEALKILYKLNYLYPGDDGISRVLAWSLTLDHKFEQADRIYTQLLSADHPLPADMLNYGYSLWFARELTTAIGMFRQFLNSPGNESFNIEAEFCTTEYQQLRAQGLSDAEIQLMLDQLV